MIDKLENNFISDKDLENQNVLVKIYYILNLKFKYDRKKLILYAVLQIDYLIIKLYQ